MNNKNAFNITLDITKFENLKFEQWKRLVQYVLNYDLWLSNVEKLDQLNLNKAQLEAFIECHGVIPNQYQPLVNELNKKYDEVKRIRQEIEISDLDLSFKVKNVEQLSILEKELDEKIINKGIVDKTKKQLLYFQNPYFIDGDDQLFSQRLPSLKQELADIEWIIKHELKPKLKKSLRMMDLIEIEFRRVLGVKDKKINVLSLFYFVRPYINQIISSDDFFYNELLSLSLN